MSGYHFLGPTDCYNIKNYEHYCVNDFKNQIYQINLSYKEYVKSTCESK